MKYQLDSPLNVGLSSLVVSRYNMNCLLRCIDTSKWLMEVHLNTHTLGSLLDEKSGRMLVKFV